jgi:hypothetical protein
MNRLKYALLACLMLLATSLMAQQKRITILFAYTTKAAMEVGGPQEIKKNVTRGIFLLNQALRNSNVGYEAMPIAEFVHVKDESVVGENGAGDLIREFNNPQGRFNKVHQFRKQKQADLMCLIFEGGRTSMGMLNGEVMVVTAKGAWDGTWIFPHEFGHVLGAEHDEDAYSRQGLPEPAYDRYLHDFGHAAYKYRTVSNNGGVSLPYFSEDREITHTENGITKTIRLGDQYYDNAAILRRNAPNKVKLGENLSDVPSVAGALDAELVNPDTAPIPAGAKTPYEFKSLTFSKNGLVSFSYDASEDFARKYAFYFVLKFYDETGKSDPWLGSYSSGLNPGYPNTHHHTVYSAERVKDGYKVELWSVDYGDPNKKTLVATSVVGAPAGGGNTSPAPAPAPTAGGDGGDDLPNIMDMGQMLLSGEKMTSRNGAHSLEVTADGNMVVTHKSGNTVWSSGTTGHGTGTRLVMQDDGHLVLYNKQGAALWASGTHSSRDPKYDERAWKPVRMILRDNGSIELISAAKQVVWSSASSKGERLR